MLCWPILLLHVSMQPPPQIPIHHYLSIKLFNNIALIIFNLQLLWCHQFLNSRALSCRPLFPFILHLSPSSLCPALPPCFPTVPALLPLCLPALLCSLSLSLCLSVLWLGGTGLYYRTLTGLLSVAFWRESSATRCLFLFVCFMLHCTSRWPVVAMSRKREASSSNQRRDEN